jgi:Rrf2 family protein
MNFNKTTSYSLSILNYMARKRDQVISADTLHEKLDIPYHYLRRILTDLSKGGFITGSRGRFGGFTFERSLNEIFLYEIIQSIEGDELFGRCIMNYTVCPFDNICPLHELWQSTREGLIKILKNTSLNDLIKRENLQGLKSDNKRNHKH